MITPLTITSLNQGKDLARWHVEKLYAEPVPPVASEMVTATDAATPLSQARRGGCMSLVARFVALCDAALPIGLRRI